MHVCVYAGSEKLVNKSGVGVAMGHQTSMLSRAGHTVEPYISRETEVVHINTVFPNSVLAAIKAKIKKKAVVYYGHSTMEDFRHSFIGSDLIAPAFGKWIKFCYSLGDVIITPTTYSKQLLTAYGIQKPIVALSNGIDTGYYAPDPKERKAFRKAYQIPEDAKVVMSVGHYIERKGILDFIQMAQAFPEVTFLWFGYTNPKLIPDKIKQAIANAPKNIKFPGFVSKEKLRQAYCGCDLFCFMSHEETEGIVVLEALACGIPTLVRDIPVYQGWLKHKEHTYKAVDRVEFIQYIEGILTQQLPNLVENGRAIAYSRSYEAIEQQLEEIYESIGVIYQRPPENKYVNLVS